jgi:hypothetical protein
MIYGGSQLGVDILSDLLAQLDWGRAFEESACANEENELNDTRVGGSIERGRCLGESR